MKSNIISTNETRYKIIYESIKWHNVADSIRNNTYYNQKDVLYSLSSELAMKSMIKEGNVIPSGHNLYKLFNCLDQETKNLIISQTGNIKPISVPPKHNDGKTFKYNNIEQFLETFPNVFVDNRYIYEKDYLLYDFEELKRFAKATITIAIKDITKAIVKNNLAYTNNELYYLSILLSETKMSNIKNLQRMSKHFYSNNFDKYYSFDLRDQNSIIQNCISKEYFGKDYNPEFQKIDSERRFGKNRAIHISNGYAVLSRMYNTNEYDNLFAKVDSILDNLDGNSCAILIHDHIIFNEIGAEYIINSNKSYNMIILRHFEELTIISNKTIIKKTSKRVNGIYKKLLKKFTIFPDAFD